MKLAENCFRSKRSFLLFHLMKKSLLFLFLVVLVLNANSQCADGELELSMNVYTDSWPAETYWEIVQGTNSCGDGTIAWGGNINYVGCTGGGEQNAGYDENVLPANSIVNVNSICLTEGEFYTLYFVDDWGDGGLWFEMFMDGGLVGFYAGSGIGNAWTFQAGASLFAAHDSPCNALELQSDVAVEMSNVNCITQVNEIHPFSGFCSVPGFWCPDEMTNTVWAKFIVPDDGSYEVSTVLNGTILNTQIAVWVSDDCSNADSFVLITANDDFLGESDITACTSTIPTCVDQGSAAFNNVIDEMPACCDTEWDVGCQALYDVYETSCQGVESCYYILEAFDTYGDGWNDGYVTMTVDGVSNAYGLAEGNYASFEIPVFEGASITLEFIAGGWPEEVVIALKTSTGIPLVYVQQPEPLVYEGFATCNNVAWSNPQASKCFINCLPPGTECYIQIDGYQYQTGNFILEVKPFGETFEVTEYINHVTCPDGSGADPEGAIIAQVDGFALNYDVQWSGPNGFESNELFIGNLNPGTYLWTASDLCGHQLEAEFVVEGPQSYDFESTVTPTCVNETNGAITATGTGGTPPYSFMWFDQEGNELGASNLTDLSAGFYYLLMVDANLCSIAYPVEVPALELAEFSIGEDLSICNNAVILLEGPEGLEYIWSDGTTTQDLILHAGDYEIGENEISLEVITTDGCVSEDTLMLTVLQCVGLNELNDESVIIYPNPANDVVRIQSPELIQSFMIYAMDGRMVHNQKVNAHSWSLNLAANKLDAGIYHCVLNTGGKMIHRDIVVTN